MSMSGALNNALSGLTANARIAEVVSSNLSNALTDGYGRRSVSLSAVQVGDAGGGVRVDAINRFVDAGLLADRRLADAALSGHERSADMLVRLQQYLGGPDDEGGIVGRLAAFERALISAGSDPASQTRLADVVSRLDDVARSLQNGTKAIQSLRQDADAAIARDVDTLNRALLQVEGLNADILRISGSGNDPSALLDARQRAVDQVAATQDLLRRHIDVLAQEFRSLGYDTLSFSFGGDSGAASAKGEITTDEELTAETAQDVRDAVQTTPLPASGLDLRL